MQKLDEFDAMAEVCIANHDAIVRLGSSEMQAASRLLLFALSKAIIGRDDLKLSQCVDRHSERRTAEVKQAARTQIRRA